MDSTYNIYWYRYVDEFFVLLSFSPLSPGGLITVATQIKPKGFYFSPAFFLWLLIKRVAKYSYKNVQSIRFCSKAGSIRSWFFLCSWCLFPLESGPHDFNPHRTQWFRLQEHFDLNKAQIFKGNTVFY